MENEKRLIDREQAKRATYEEVFWSESEQAVVRNFLAKLPTVDAVEVVRCKDCKHYGWEQEPCHGRTQRFCKLHKGLVIVDRDTFCSYGERREG